MAEYILELRETSPLKSVRQVCQLWAWNSLILILLMLSTSSPFAVERFGEDWPFIQAGRYINVNKE